MPRVGWTQRLSCGGTTRKREEGEDGEEGGRGGKTNSPCIKGAPPSPLLDDRQHSLFGELVQWPPSACTVVIIVIVFFLFRFFHHFIKYALDVHVLFSSS
jgi:hypothetical protein